MTYPIGQKFNKLLVVEKIVKNNGTRNYTGYKCLCDCGNIKEFTALFDLKNNKAQSCGCINNGSWLVKDITGNHYGSFTVLERLNTKTTDGYDYRCKCSCGKEKIVKYNNLVRGDTKSCGCKSDYYNSINNGGTGIPRENIELQKAIRLCKQYRAFKKLCLTRAAGISELSGNSGTLEVHHFNAVSYLIKNNNLTKENYLQCSELFDPANAIVLTTKEHKEFHKQQGLVVCKSNWIDFVCSR